ncbi:LIM/homeobox protein ceh-14-like [Mercenaria mercenaria]|uniref:LIM/homeobox protein ceh-14-like n=1 Tax=Mercenaria mercenaria TaxID=6596 RepID=UPI00234F89D0|nr:LIM/homeobox protein ceh-14-like [Mercenaria mercenaria]
MKDNELYCRTDFTRLFGAKCSGCSEIISPSEGVHVANSNLYHIECFSCITCRCRLQPGHYFYMKDDGKLLCSSDYRNLLCKDSADTDSGSDESGSDDTDTRHRMFFNDNQLRMLTAAYQSNKRPSRSLMKQISGESGLSVRTIQIWFQNRRAKDKALQKKTQANNSNNFNNIKIMQNSNQFQQQNQPYSQKTLHYEYEGSLENYQLYCPLDFLVPNEMPPNVDLSSADICNGEVIAGKRDSNSFPVPQQTPQFLPDGIQHWLTV